MRILDYYFRRPIFYDYLFSSISALFIVFALRKQLITAPNADLLYSMVSDLATVSLTLSGFLLTLITILISFKSTNRVNPQNIKETDTVFDIFFASALYFETIKHLKSGIVSLVFISVIGYVLKLSIPIKQSAYLLAFNTAGLIIVVLTLGRGLTILTQIVKMQRQA